MMATEHCDTMMIKRESWYHDTSSSYEQAFTNLDPFGHESLALHSDADAKYPDTYWEPAGVQPRGAAFLQPPLDCEERLGARKSCELAVYEEGVESTTPGSQHAYSSSPSSINSPHCGEYPAPYYGHDALAKKPYCQPAAVDAGAYDFAGDGGGGGGCYYYGVASPLRDDYVADPANPLYPGSVAGVGQRPPVIKRRNTANRKERRRTQSINNAFADLRDCIPNVPADTKLSKIKTLRLATSYIGYLMGVLSSEDPDAACGDGFKADLSSHHAAKKGGVNVTSYAIRFSQISTKVDKVTDAASLSNFAGDEDGGKKTKGRTGWPQHVWALELKQEQV